jgi:methionine-rich copper-binding protein CopC
LGIGLGVATPALAHTELVSSTPRKGAVVARLPARITLTFTEPPLRVTGAKVLLGKVNHARSARLNPRNAKQVVIRTASSRQGSYRVVASLVAPDGDRQLVTFGFRVKR